MLVMRSLLFVPANRANMVARAHSAGADVVVLDLEDSVPAAEKEAARSGLADAIASLKAAGRSVHVRVNQVESGLARDDLAAAVCDALDGVVLPKAQAGRDVRQIDVLIREQETRNGVRPGTPVLIPQIETAKGLLRCEEIATASTRIAGLGLGGYDYAADLGVARTAAGLELDLARGTIVQVCAAYGIQALDTPYADFGDGPGLVTETELARSLGFKGKYVIHPDQIGPVNRVFEPDEAELIEARRVVEAFEAALAAGHASVQLDGTMIDPPIERRARELLAYAAAIASRF